MEREKAGYLNICFEHSAANFFKQMTFFLP